ncbi:fimbrial protein [Serratia quinivorans]|uniref:fimbrial protein n=1 Tax=Serratia quinivorans TaxID=137545 RepID=UPI002178C3D0|nr:fimbrial protein [Serratia quinivorans]CAI1223610.1 putative fimbrial protein SthD [Serratia quinivorans]
MSMITPRILAATLASGLLISHTTLADSVTVNISGNVVASPCIVDGSAITNVILDDIDISELTTAGSSGTNKFFDLKLKECPARTTKVTATFSGIADKNNSNYFANSGTADNVAIQIKDIPAAWASNVITPTGGKTMTVNVVATDHTAKFSLVTRIISPDGTAQPGTVNSAIQVSFTYQ